MSDVSYTHLPRIRVGEYFARRDETGKLVETGFIDDEGVEHRDKMPHPDQDDVRQDRIDGSNPAASVPYDQKWA